MQQYSQRQFIPRKPVRTFRDLEVYTRTLECAIDIVKKISKSKTYGGFFQREHMINCALSVPLWIAESHSLRFGDQKRGVLLLEQAMAGCNKMVVYLEELRGIYGIKADNEQFEELIKKYVDTRGKIFRLEKSWQKWDTSR